MESNMGADYRNMEHYQGSLEFQKDYLSCGCADFRNWQDYRRNADFFESAIFTPSEDVSPQQRRRRYTSDYRDLADDRA